MSICAIKRHVIYFWWQLARYISKRNGAKCIVSSDIMVHGIPNANSEKTLEELRRVVVTLPHMPKNIVDDARHEKVLSFVSAFIAQADQQLMQTMLKDWAILDVLQVS